MEASECQSPAPEIIRQAKGFPRNFMSQGKNSSNEIKDSPYQINLQISPKWHRPTDMRRLSQTKCHSHKKPKKFYEIHLRKYDVQFSFEDTGILQKL